MDILVTGGAGYIGSFMCKMLARHGHRPVVLDNLCRGHRQAVKWGPLFVGSVSDEALLDRIFSEFEIKAVMHFAAFAYVGESVEDPGTYYRNNTAEALFLLNKMAAHKVLRFVFSSTCATYGEPRRIPIDEYHPQAPVNPYGRSKWMVEQILKDFDHAYGLKYMALRYFNAAGADPDGEIGEDHRPETHLIPLVLQAALGQRKEIAVFGDDYPTQDGTCIRDYIHNYDLASAHLLALDRLMDSGGSDRYNLGNGNGYSVRQVIETARKVTGRPIAERTTGRRPGDPAVLVASSGKAIQELGWRPQFADLETMIETAWRWHKVNPHGYEE